MPRLVPVPDLDPAEYFTTIPVCLTCPPGSLGFEITQKPQDWEVKTWHEPPCWNAAEAPTVTGVRACHTCHTWNGADLIVSALIPGQWAFIPKHGRTPLTSQDGTANTASGGEYCPQMEIDSAFIGRLTRRHDGRRNSLRLRLSTSSSYRVCSSAFYIRPD
jgi:hypothetical protein